MIYRNPIITDVFITDRKQIFCAQQWLLTYFHQVAMMNKSTVTDMLSCKWGTL